MKRSALVDDPHARQRIDLGVDALCPDALITALSTGRELRIAPHEVAEKTARQFEDYPKFAERHLAALKDILDSDEPDYRD